MRTLLVALLVALAVCFPAAPPAAADEPAASVRAVIEDQLAAFRRNDLGAAFAHASPGVQAMFRTPETFGRMVETGYPMIWRPARHQILALEENPAGLVQTVLFEDLSGRLFEADYLLVQVGAEWRIAGVELRALPGIGV